MFFIILCNLFVRVVDRGVGLCKAGWNPATHKCGSFGPALARSLAVARSLACHVSILRMQTMLASNE